MKKRILTIIIAAVLIGALLFAGSAFVKTREAELVTAYSETLEQAKAETAAAQQEADRAEAEATALQGQLESAHEQQQFTREMLVDLILRVDYQDEPIYVIGHQTPDADTSGAAIGMAYLLNSLGIPAEARITGNLNAETKYAYNELNVAVPEILADAAGKQLWLVDHSASTQMVNGGDEASIVGIIDHHAMGDVVSLQPICVLSCPAGSTSAVVCMLCGSCGVEIPQDVAGALLTGMLSDTSNMTVSDVTKLDEAAFAKLKELTGVTDTETLFNGMQKAHLSYEGMSDPDIFYSDYKEYEHNGHFYGIACVKVAETDDIPGMAERMQEVLKTEMENDCEHDFIMYHIYDRNHAVGYSGIVGKDVKYGEGLMDAAFGGLAGREGDFYVFAPSLSRKADIAPKIDSYLETIAG